MDAQAFPEERDETVPLPLEEAELPAFASVRVIAHHRGMHGHDLAWHPELQAGSRCPQCQRHPLKRHRSTVYCRLCRLRWWSQRQR